MNSHILIALANQEARVCLAAQLDTDGYDVLEASTTTNTLAMLQRRPVSLVMLGDLERPPAAVHLLRDLRDAKLDLAVDPNLPVMTIGADDELTRLRAYEAGSDHHVASDANYILLRAIIAAVVRRTTGKAKARQLNVGPLHIDTGTYEVRINGEHIHMPKREFELLATLAAEPTRVFTKSELNEALWGYPDDSRSRTVDSHACRLRRRLAEHGQHMIISRWGVGYKLIGPS